MENVGLMVALAGAMTKAPSSAQVETAVDAWLDDHPEATTTVQDGVITNAKLASSFVTPGTAAAYSSSATYAVGDYVFHNGVLYRCISAISTAEAWTAAHWTAAVLGDDIGDLKNALTNLNTLWVPIEQGYWAVVDGIATNSTTWCRTKDFIDRNFILSVSDYYIYVLAYNKKTGAYVGTWNGSEFNTTYSSNGGMMSFESYKWHASYPDYIFKLDFYSGSGSVTITPSNVQSVLNVSCATDDLTKIMLDDGDYLILHPGTRNGTIVNSENTYSVCTGFIPVSGPGTMSCIVNKELANDGIHYTFGYALYDSTQQMIGSNHDFSHDVANYQRDIKIENSKVKYIRFTISEAKESGYVTLRRTDFADGDVIIKFTADKIDCGNGYVISINHRGFSTVAPENTIPAYIMSKRAGFHYVECDVQFTHDGVAVLLHDTTINRTARNVDGTTLESTINLEDIDYESLLDYDFGIWMGSQFAGTKIPTFDEFIVACKKLSLHPVIELKDEGEGTYWTDARIKVVADSIKKYGMSEHVSFISFSKSAIEKITAIFPKAMIGVAVDNYGPSGIADFAESISDLLSDDHVLTATCDYESMADSWYDILVNAGIQPIVWTVDKENIVLGLPDTVYGVLSNCVNASTVYAKNMIETLP